TYGGRDGRVSQRDTSLTFDGSPGESFTQSFTYDVLGPAKTLSYPRCTHAVCLGSTAAVSPTITNNYTEGLLASVQNGTLTYGTLTYHPNLLVNTIQHANGVLETQQNDGNSMRRPASITSTFGANTYWSTGTYSY